MLFARLLPRLIDRIHYEGFGITFGEVYRPQETVELYALQGRGFSGSLHPLRCAVDLHLFRFGSGEGDEREVVFLSRTEDHEPFGRYWTGLDPKCRWGGNFKAKPDGNHYSVTWKGSA